MIDAGRELVVDHRIADIDIVRVCDRAGLTRRYFYQEFADIDTYLDEVFRAHAEDAAVAIIAAAVAARGDLSDRIAAGMEAAIAFVMEGFGGKGSAESTLSATAMFSRHRAALTDVAFAKALEMYKAVNGGEPMPSKLHGYTAIVVGGTAEALLRWLRGDLDLTRDELVATCVDGLGLMRSALDDTAAIQIPD